MSDTELKEYMAETAKQIRELGKQIGGLGNKFGSFAEGMALPSMTKILRKQFKLESVGARQTRSGPGGKEMEVDVLGYSNGKTNLVCVVEVKSHLREESLDQMRSILDRFFEFYPEHKGKRLFGILAYVDASDDVEKKAIDEGIYLARIHDDSFSLAVPKGFKPKYRTAA
jgi:hypothetical protein